MASTNNGEMGSMGSMGSITLIGSGELGESMAKAYRPLLARLRPPLNAVFVDTPAGFQVNADEISAKAVEYFRQRFDLALDVASFRSKNRATALEVEAALHRLYHANFIFAGPGSPSYAIRHWCGSAVWDTMVARLQAGAQLVLASAAAIAVGCMALPVYEIYKAGHEVAWIDGLDLLATLALKLAIVPHWNNTEGGTYDTRFCYMGQARLHDLETQLPFDVVILGIDEHTAVTLDLNTQQGTVSGAGQATVRYAGSQHIYPAGSSIPFAQLRAANLGSGAPLGPVSPSGQTPPPAEPAASTRVVTTTLFLDQIARAMEETHELSSQRELIDHAHETMHELAQEWQTPDTLGGAGQDIRPLVELLISLRGQLRTAKQYTLADQVREQLNALGITLEDTSAGTRWKQA